MFKKGFFEAPIYWAYSDFGKQLEIQPMHSRSFGNEIISKKGLSKILGKSKFVFCFFLRFCSIQSFGVPNKTRYLVIDIFKLSTSRQISLSGCTYNQKHFIQVAQLQISPDAGARQILTLVYQFLTHNFRHLNQEQRVNLQRSLKKSQGKILPV